MGKDYHLTAGSRSSSRAFGPGTFSYVNRRFGTISLMQGQLGVARLLWGALFISTLIYIVILEVTSIESGADWRSLAPIFAFAGVGAAGASLIAPRFVRTEPVESAEDVPSESRSYLVALILSLALAESVCILGLVLGFLGAPPRVVMPFFFVTWVLMILRFPTQAKLDAQR